MGPLINIWSVRGINVYGSVIDPMSDTHFAISEIKPLLYAMLKERKGTQIIREGSIKGYTVISLLARITWIYDPPILSRSQYPWF